MIFERLTLHNFQRYGGTNTIEFPVPEETSLVVSCLADADLATDEIDLAKLIDQIS